MRQCLGATSVSLPSLIDLSTTSKAQTSSSVPYVIQEHAELSRQQSVDQTCICDSKVPGKGHCTCALFRRTWPDFSHCASQHDRTWSETPYLAENSLVDLAKFYTDFGNPAASSWERKMMGKLFREMEKDYTRSKLEAGRESENPFLGGSSSERLVLGQIGSRPKARRWHADLVQLGDRRRLM